MGKTNLTIVVIAKNEEEGIICCLQKLLWGDELIVVDTGSNDKTMELARKITKNVFQKAEGSFSDWRNFGLSKASGEWILYIDVDEEVPEKLIEEISAIVKNKDTRAYFDISRLNIFFGRPVKHGGFWPDRVPRLFRREKIKTWKGDLHELPQVSGDRGELKNYIIHRSRHHQNLEAAVANTMEWSRIEAKLLYESGHPPMIWWRFIRIIMTEFFDRYFIKIGFLDGGVGLIEAIYQSYSRFITYAKLWELQQNQLVNKT